MLNHCTFIGNVGADPEVRALANGTKMAKFSIAVTETWKDKAGEKQQRTEWIEITCFGPLSNVIENYVKKGDKLYCAGRWTNSSWENEAGEKRYKTELNLRDMVMLGGNSAAANNAPSSAAQAPTSQQLAAQRHAPKQTAHQAAVQAGQQDDDDNLPF